MYIFSDTERSKMQYFFVLLFNEPHTCSASSPAHSEYHAMIRMLFVAIFSTALLVPADFAAAQRLFVLVAGDTSDEVVGEGIQQNMKWIRDTFYAHVPKERLIVRFLAGTKLSQESLLASIDQCPIQADDTLMLWWLGQSQDAEQQRHLTLPDGSKIRASAIAKRLVARSARLSVVILDGYARSLPAAELPPKTMEQAVAVELDPAFDSLFFQPSGIVQVCSAQIGQRPLATTRTGGLLTCGLILPPGVLGDVNDQAGFLELHTPSGERDVVLERGILWQELSPSVQWDTVLAQLSSTTVANYRRALGRKHSADGQTPDLDNTRLKYADRFVEWHAGLGEFRSRPREQRMGSESEFPVSIDRDLTPSTDDSTIRSIEDLGRSTASITQDQIQGSTVDQDDELDVGTADDTGNYQMIPGDHLVEIDGHRIRNARDFETAMQHLRTHTGTVRFVAIDNMTGKHVHFETTVNPDRDRDFGIKPWYWKDAQVIVHDVCPGSPAARAVVTKMVAPNLPPEVGLGIRGRLIKAKHPLIDDETIIGIQVQSVTDPQRSDLKPGDLLFSIDGYGFASEAGYRFALRSARVLAGIWFVDGATGKVKHGHVLLPHLPAEELASPPDDVTYLSITPDNMESCPIW
jgi:hypothetical protein